MKNSLSPMWLLVFFLQLGRLCPDRDFDLRRLHLGPCLNLLVLCLLCSWQRKSMKKMQAIIWSACSDRMLSTTAICGLPWMLRTQGFFNRTHKKVTGMLFSRKGVGVTRCREPSSLQRKKINIYNNCHHVPNPPFCFVEQQLRSKES